MVVLRITMFILLPFSLLTLFLVLFQILLLAPLLMSQNPILVLVIFQSTDDFPQFDNRYNSKKSSSRVQANPSQNSSITRPVPNYYMYHSHRSNGYGGWAIAILKGYESRSIPLSTILIQHDINSIGVDLFDSRLVSRLLYLWSLYILPILKLIHNR